MRLGEAAKLFAANAAWRAGSASAGRLLVDGLSSPDESNRTIAGMFLVRGGERAAPLLDEELEQPRNLPMLLRVMGDTAPERFRPVLERYATSDDPQISRAAQDALRAGRARRGDDR